MSELETALREMFKARRLGPLTLHSGPDKCSASHRAPGSDGYNVAHGSDPVAALLEALAGGYDGEEKRWRTWRDNLPTEAADEAQTAPGTGVLGDLL